jgi:hypothetical protein
MVRLLVAGYEVTARVLPALTAVPRVWRRQRTTEKENEMQIDKQQILEFLRSRGDQQQADQAQSELPDQVDTEQHGDLLAKFGINPQELLSGGLGGLGGKLGL